MVAYGSYPVLPLWLGQPLKPSYVSAVLSWKSE